MLHARYVDGQRPLAHDAEIMHDDAGLAITVPRQGLRLVWTPEATRLEKDGAQIRLFSIRDGQESGEQLTVNRAAFEAMFAEDLRRFRTRRLGEAGGVRIAMWSVLAVASMALLLLVGLPLFAGVAAPLVPYRWEASLGESVEKEVLQMVGNGKDVQICTRPGTLARAALDEMITKLTPSLRLQGPLKVEVIDVPVTNAFALPGGRIFLFRPVIEKATSPDEVAGVLAHEIGHVVNRDAMRGVLHDGALSVLAGLVLGDVTGGTAIALLGRMALGSAFSREQEREADRVSVDLMQKAGADPRAINIFFKRLIKEVDASAPRSASDLFSSHPMTDERIETVDRLAEDAPSPKRPILERQQWLALKNACARG
ncbi:HtpX Zn-dependent protease with chaperone function [Rhabdaerophilaceae bacterium]